MIIISKNIDNAIKDTFIASFVFPKVIGSTNNTKAYVSGRIKKC